jgi:hypothetical protein
MALMPDLMLNFGQEQRLVFIISLTIVAEWIAESLFKNGKVILPKKKKIRTGIQTSKTLRVRNQKTFVIFAILWLFVMEAYTKLDREMKPFELNGQFAPMVKKSKTTNYKVALVYS